MNAVVTVAYLKATYVVDHVQVGYVFGKAELVPQPNLSYPSIIAVYSRAASQDNRHDSGGN